MLSKHTIGSGSCNRFLSPLVGQITVWLIGYLGRFYYALYPDICVDGELIFTQFNALMQKIGSWHRYLGTQ